jgi:hypothetical protein
MTSSQSSSYSSSSSSSSSSSNSSSPPTSILSKSLSEKPLTNSEQSDYIHSLIMMEQVPLNLCMKTSS